MGNIGSRVAAIRGYVRGICPLRRVWGASQNIFLFYFPMGNIGSRAAAIQGYVRGRCPLRRVWGASQNIFLFYFPMGNIGSRAARATVRVAPTGLHGLNVYRAAYGFKQTIWGGVCASERCYWSVQPQNEHHTMNRVACFPTSTHVYRAVFVQQQALWGTQCTLL